MIFKPRSCHSMWDTWLFYHQGTHYLYYLAVSNEGSSFDSIGVATSRDGVSFDDHGLVIRKAADAVWLGTGKVWQVRDKYLMNFSENRNNIQEIFFAESDDLLHWHRLPDSEYVCRSDPRWYSDGTEFSPQRWDTIWVLRDEELGDYYGYLTAVAQQGPVGLHGTSGYVVSDDGRHFHAAPPAIEPGFWGDKLEIGAVERIGSRYYMLAAQAEIPLGVRHVARYPSSIGGMYVLTSERREGPFRLDPRQKPLMVSSPIHYSYYARFYPFQDAMLLNHHTVARIGDMATVDPKPETHLAPLKEVHVDPSGTLSLHWWHGNDILTGRELSIDYSRPVLHGVSRWESFPASRTLRLSAAAGGIAIVTGTSSCEKGVVITMNCTLEESDGPIAGVGLFLGTGEGKTGTVLIHATDDRVATGAYNGYAFKPEDFKEVRMLPRSSYFWRAIVRGIFVELYIDDEYVQSYTLPSSFKGTVGIVVESAKAEFADIHVHEMAIDG